MTNDRFAAARAAFCAVHREDPRGRALAYHEAVAAWVDALRPDASEPLRLAAWCQHLRRWSLPRTDYPPGRTGYKRWRSDLARRHADEAGAILRRIGYDDDTIARVGQLLVKARLRSDAEVGVLEDAVCLVFLQQEAAAFAASHPPDKVVAILQKTWAKMTEEGRAQALAIADALPPGVHALLQRALEG